MTTLDQSDFDQIWAMLLVATANANIKHTLSRHVRRDHAILSAKHRAKKRAAK